MHVSSNIHLHALKSFWKLLTVRTFSANSKREGKRLDKEHEALKKTPFKLGNITIHHEGYPTCVDGKVVRTWEGNTDESVLSTSICDICGANERERAKRNGKFKPNLKMLRYGIRNLHSRLRAFDYFFKVGTYRDVGGITAYGDENKESVKKWKEYQIAEFDRRLKLDVFKVVPGKIGNTNTGETSRYLTVLS